MTRALSLFGDTRLQMTDSIQLTVESLLAYGPQHRHWAIAWSGGKDSTTLLTVVIHLLDTKRVPRPETLTVLYADTRLELTPLALAAQEITEELRDRNIEVRTVLPPLDKRFLVYVLGRGVPPPNNNTLRWCTRQIKVDPMQRELERLAVERGTGRIVDTSKGSRFEAFPGEKVLMLTVDRPFPVLAGSPTLGLMQPFLVKYNGTGGSHSVDAPLDTITAVDRFALVSPELVPAVYPWSDVIGWLDIKYRMLFDYELAAASGFPKSYTFAGSPSQPSEGAVQAHPDGGTLMPLYRLTWDENLHVRSLEFEARSDEHAELALKIGQQLGQRFGARRFALKDRKGHHVAGWQGQAVPRERVGQLRMDVQGEASRLDQSQSSQHLQQSENLK